MCITLVTLRRRKITSLYTPPILKTKLISWDLLIIYVNFSKNLSFSDSLRNLLSLEGPFLVGWFLISHSVYLMSCIPRGYKQDGKKLAIFSNVLCNLCFQSLSIFHPPTISVKDSLNYEIINLHQRKPFSVNVNSLV